MGTTQSNNANPNSNGINGSGSSDRDQQNFDNIYAANSASSHHTSNYNLSSAGIPPSPQHNSSFHQQRSFSSQNGTSSGGVISGLKNEPIRPELLMAEINGEIAENDYFARSLSILSNIQIDNIEIYPNSNDAIELEDVYLLAEPGYLTVENGIVRKNDGSLYIAVFVDLGYEINGNMFDWWFCNNDNNEKSRWFHPLNHVNGTWDPSFYSMMPFERNPGHYIDHIQITQQYIPPFSTSNATLKSENTSTSANGASSSASSGASSSSTTNENDSKNPLYSIQIEYIRPSKFFDINKFEENNITSCIIGKLNIKDNFFSTYIHIGYVFYIIREINGRSELRIRYFLGDFFYYLENNENYYYSTMIHYLTNNYLFRILKLPISFGKDLYKNCLEEMLCLKEFLPNYYKTTLQEQREFQLTYSFTN
jgi:hypothetical protein